MVNPTRVNRTLRRNAVRGTVAVGLLTLVAVSATRGLFVQRTDASAGFTSATGVDLTPGVLSVPGEYPTIQSAIEDALPGDRLVVGPGAWRERIDFGGRAITIVSSDGASTTSISGDGSSGPIVTFGSGGSVGAVLEGFTITSGRSGTGAGIVVAGGSPEVSRCTVRDNEGCGVVISGGKPTFLSCQISGNSGDAGGGILVDAGEPQLIDCAVDGNRALTFGGGLCLRGGRTVLMRGTVNGNRTTSGAFGGGLYTEGGSIDVFDAVIEGNASEEMGGGAFVANGTAGFYGCNFKGNLSGRAFTIAGSGLVQFAGSTLYGSAVDHIEGGIATDGLNFDTAAVSDCDHDGLSDSDSIHLGMSQDCDGNGVPDDCDTDCNENGVVDACEIRAGLATDCNGNGVLDQCEINWGLEQDSDFDGRIDNCGGR